MSAPIDSRTVRTISPAAAGAPTEPGSARPDAAAGEPVTGGGGVAVDLTRGPVDTVGGPDTLADPVPLPEKSVTHALLAARLTRDIVATEQHNLNPTPVTLEQIRNGLAAATPKQSATVDDINDLGVLSDTDIADLRLERLPASALADYYNSLLRAYQGPGGVEVLQELRRLTAVPEDVADGWDHGWELKFREAAHGLGIQGPEEHALIASLKADNSSASDADLQKVLDQLKATDPSITKQTTSLTPAQSIVAGVTDETIKHAAAASPGWNDEWAALLRTELAAAGASSEQSVSLVQAMPQAGLSSEDIERIIRHSATPAGQELLKATAKDMPTISPKDMTLVALAGLGGVGTAAAASTGLRALGRSRQLRGLIAASPDAAGTVALAKARPSAAAPKAAILQARAETRALLLDRSAALRGAGQPRAAAGAARVARSFAPRIPMSPLGGLRWLVGMNPRPGVAQAGLGAAERIMGRAAGPLALAGAAALGIWSITGVQHAEGSAGPETAKAVGDTIGSIGGGIAGMALGASLGSRLPGGALLGGLAGGIVGSTAGSLTGMAIARGPHQASHTEPPTPGTDAGSVRSGD